jgi:hypothetical protein
MARFITLTHNDGKGRPRVNVDNIGFYVRRDGFSFTRVTLRTVDGGDSDAMNVSETEGEIDALIAAVSP